MTIVSHYNGSPDGCSEDCSANNQHPDDAPQGFVCTRCGGGGACYPICQEAGVTETECIDLSASSTTGSLVQEG